MPAYPVDVARPLVSKIHISSFKRTYFSFSYFVVPHEQKTDFLDFSSESLEKLDSALEGRFEALLQGSGKTSSYDPVDLDKHIKRQPAGSQANSLRKALEEVAILYSWDRPMLQSPVKIRGISGMGGSGGLGTDDESSKNLVYIISKIPDNSSEVTAFLGKRAKTVRDVQEALFNQKRLVTNLKDSEIKVSVVDTSQPGGRGLASTNCEASALDPKTKELFEKALRSMVRGTVLPASALVEDFTSVQVSNVLREYNSASGWQHSKQSNVTCHFPREFNRPKVEFKRADLTRSPEVSVCDLEAICWVDRTLFPGMTTDALNIFQKIWIYLAFH